MTQRRAVALISGGLDSMLAAKCIQDQGILVEGINFFTGFCIEGHTHAMRKTQKKPKRNNALWVAEQLGIKLHIIDIVEEYKDIVLNPKYGYGANLNPCLDCKRFMIDQAKAWMQKNGFDFIITGEVVGQRPKSQRKENLHLLSKICDVKDILVRPLCAKNLPSTHPEEAGWIQRNKMFDFSGRSRKGQFQLAKDYQIEDYAQPAGGCCFLTDKHYSAKLLDLWQSQGHRQYELDDILLLKVGRHLRPAPHFKLIIGREESENNYLKGYQNQFISIAPISHPGPLTLIDGTPTEEDIALCARISARFGQGRDEDQVTLAIKMPQGETTEQSVIPLPAYEIPDNWYIERHQNLQKHPGKKIDL